MPKPRSNPRPTFLWQAVLIVLPVIALAVMGSLSLRQDRLLVEQQARAQAQEIADDLVVRLWTALTNLSAAAPPASADLLDPTATPSLARRLRFSATDELLDPPPIADLVPHRLDPSSLDDPEARLWQAAREAELRERDLAKAAEAWDQFLPADPPAEFAAAARFNLGIVLSRQGRLDPAVDEMARAVTNHPDAMLESGLPLPTVAGLKWLETTARLPRPATLGPPDWLEALCSNAVSQPTPLSSMLLSTAAEAERKNGGRSAHAWRNRWERHEQSRSLVPAVRRALFAGGMATHPAQTSVQPSGPRLFWFHHDGAWLALAETHAEAGFEIICEPESVIILILEDTVSRSRNLPSYFGMNLELGGRSLATSLLLRSRLDVRQTPTRNLVTKPVFVAADGRIPASDSPGADAAVNGLWPGFLGNSGVTLRQGNLLAMARKVVGPIEALRIGMYLQDPAQLFAQQRTRALWFGGLIGVAAIVALVGLATAWRAFTRQLRLNEMKSNFVSSVSHELRAPIASVRLLAESLERGTVADPDRQAEYFKLIVQECRRLGALITNVLDFSRIDQGRKQYEFEPTDLVALVQQTVQLMQPYATERQVTLTLSPENVQPSTFNVQRSAFDLQPSIDGRAIQQALVNLIDNAIKHAPAATTVTVGLEQGGVNAERGVRNAEHGRPASALRLPTSDLRPPASVVRRPTSDLRPPPSVLLWVEDLGPGIPSEEHEKIFEPFYRRGSELRRETQGVGIGLTIVKHVVEAHGGRVTVRSAVGQGSRFTIELPVHPNAMGESPTKAD